MGKWGIAQNRRTTKEKTCNARVRYPKLRGTAHGSCQQLPEGEEEAQAIDRPPLACNRCFGQTWLIPWVILSLGQILGAPDCLIWLFFSPQGGNLIFFDA